MQAGVCSMKHVVELLKWHRALGVAPPRAVATEAADGYKRQYRKAICYLLDYSNESLSFREEEGV